MIAGRCGARAGVLRFERGDVPTPAFMPVGTLGSVKGVAPQELRELGARIILGNAYHLMLRPGAELVAELGGLHRFSAWDGPILTDSGGFQVFSLGRLRSVDDDGVSFRSHIDGSLLRVTPERAVEVQELLGSDILMAFDEPPPADAGHDAPQVGLVAVHVEPPQDTRQGARQVGLHERPPAEGVRPGRAPQFAERAPHVGMGHRAPSQDVRDGGAGPAGPGGRHIITRPPSTART